MLSTLEEHLHTPKVLLCCPLSLSPLSAGQSECKVFLDMYNIYTSISPVHSTLRRKGKKKGDGEKRGRSGRNDKWREEEGKGGQKYKERPDLSQILDGPDDLLE